MTQLDNIRLNTNQGDILFYFRNNSTGDKGVISQIFEHLDYDIQNWQHAQKINAYINSNPERIPLIIDAGANIGAASLFFRLQYPKSVIVGLEPNLENCTIAQKNCHDIKDIFIINKAISSTGSALRLIDPGYSDWGFRTVSSDNETQGINVESLSVHQIIATFPLQKHLPLICKIDIEGAENELFSSNAEWVDEFAMIIIELHDWMLPFQGTSRNFLKVISHYDFDLLHKGENIFLFNRRLLNN